MLAKIFLTACAAAAALEAMPYEWTGIAKATHVGGRMVSPGYLRGKTVLLDVRDYADPASADALKQLQAVWSAYKTKPFIVLGSHTGTADAGKVRAAMEKLGVTYPVYAGADAEGSGSSPVRVIDSTGTRALYAGRDVRQASGAASGAIFAARMPGAAKQWKFLLDWEIENLPGQAYLRLKALAADKAASSEMKEKFPADAKRYAETRERFSESAEIKKLAKLVELSRLVKDRDRESDKAKKLEPGHLDKLEEKFGSLKNSENPFVAQEAKNALADVAFAKTTLCAGKRGKNGAGKRRR